MPSTNTSTPRLNLIRAIVQRHCERNNTTSMHRLDFIAGVEALATAAESNGNNTDAMIYRQLANNANGIDCLDRYDDRRITITNIEELARRGTGSNSSNDIDLSDFENLPTTGRTPLHLLEVRTA